MSRQSFFQRQPKIVTSLLAWVERSVARSAKYLRVLIVVVLCMLIGVETAEFTLGISDTFHLGEIIIYIFLLGIVGLLVQIVLQAHVKQQQSMNLLKYKHKFSLELLPYQTWDALTVLLTKQLAELVDARAAYLCFNNSSSHDLEPIAEWVNRDFQDAASIKPDCLTCLEGIAANLREPHYCDSQTNTNSGGTGRSYCYPILYKNELYAVFRFILNAGQHVTDEQQEILMNISDEIIIALVAGQDRKRLSELEVAETALAERHAMSHYLHDNLGQNLGYLRMKLEQLVDQLSPSKSGDTLEVELRRLKDVADESYRFVRKKLEVTIPDSTPLLVNYLQEHARKVGQRSNIAIKFINNGAAKAVPLELQQAVFFVFQEALSNVEKHSHASQVDVCLDWGLDKLFITVTDNGLGFDVDNVLRNKHFGLEIMRERMTGIGGSADILSSGSSGTTIKLMAPIPVVKKVKEVHHDS